MQPVSSHRAQDSFCTEAGHIWKFRYKPLITLYSWLRLVLAVSMMCAPAGPSLAQSLPFRAPAPTTAIAAAAGFDARAMAVIQMNACSREDDYLKFRTEMAAGNFDHEAEDLTHILVAKVAYIRAQSMSPNGLNIPCSGQIFRPLPFNADGTQPSLDDFEKADRLVRAAGPTACAQETAHFKQTTAPQGIVVELLVSPECMSRQVNEAILAMRKTTQLGSSKLPCVESLSLRSHGEFDVNVRELVRILYLSGPNSGRREGGILAPTTIDYMYTNLLAARRKLSDGAYPVTGGCTEPAGDELGSPEDTADRYAWYNELKNFLGNLVDWLARRYVEEAILSGVGGLVVMPFLLLTDADTNALPNLSVPESENHRLNIETSRYLINADMIARLEAEGYDYIDDLRADQAGVREWLLRRLQDIAAHDFQEYNARPYNRYSINSVLNLYDFAAVHGDTALATAAQIVLDLSEAKFAATSNRGRRIVPFRRLSDSDGDENAYLYESVSGADHEVPRAMLLSGQIKLLDEGKPREVEMAALAEMVNAATSDYRLPPPVLTTAVERREFRQTVRHAGVERVLQSPAFTISAGGRRTEPANTVFGQGNDADRGIAMPTVIIPTIAGAYMKDLFRFEGVGMHDKRTANTCVAPGFACGIQPKLSAAFDKCTKREVTPQERIFFVSSAECFPEVPGPHFYLAARIVDCSGTFCTPGLQWGVMDVVEATPPPALEQNHVLHAAPDPAFMRFQIERNAALAVATPDGSGNGTYVTAAGHRIDFNLAQILVLDEPSIRAIDGAPPPDWATAGDAIDSDGRGHVTLKGPGGPVIIDFSDFSNPKRTP